MKNRDVLFGTVFDVLLEPGLSSIFGTIAVARSVDRGEVDSTVTREATHHV